MGQASSVGGLSVEDNQKTSQLKNSEKTGKGCHKLPQVTITGTTLYSSTVLVSGLAAGTRWVSRGEIGVREQHGSAKYNKIDNSKTHSTIEKDMTIGKHTAQ